MTICWMNDDKHLYFARFVDLGVVAHLVVERLAGKGWDWHVWDEAGWFGSSYGQSATAQNAKAQAELALAAYRTPQKNVGRRHKARGRMALPGRAANDHADGVQQRT